MNIFIIKEININKIQILHMEHTLLKDNMDGSNNVKD